MASALLVGIDIGSSSVKAGAWRTDGYYRAAFRPARTVRPEGSVGAEQDPDQIWSAVIECLDEVMTGQDPGAVRGVGLSGHGPSLIAVDSYGRALSNIVTWMDPRPLQDARVREILCQRAGEASGAPESSSARESSGAPAPSGPSFEATAVWLHRKLLEDGHDLAREGVLLLQPKDYIGLMLTGSVWIDRSAASCMSWPAGGDPAQVYFHPWRIRGSGRGGIDARAETGLPEALRLRPGYRRLCGSSGRGCHPIRDGVRLHRHLHMHGDGCTGRRVRPADRGACCARAATRRDTRVIQRRGVGVGDVDCDARCVSQSKGLD